MSSFEAFQTLFEQSEDKELILRLMQKIAEEKQEVEKAKSEKENLMMMTQFYAMQLYKLKKILQDGVQRVEYNEKLYEEIKKISANTTRLTFLMDQIELDKIQKYNEQPQMERKKQLDELELKAKKIAEDMENRPCVKELRVVQGKLKRVRELSENLKKTAAEHEKNLALKRESAIQLRNSQIVEMIKKGKQIVELEFQLQQKEKERETKTSTNIVQETKVTTQVLPSVESVLAKMSASKTSTETITSAPVQQCVEMVDVTSSKNIEIEQPPKPIYLPKIPLPVPKAEELKNWFIDWDFKKIIAQKMQKTNSATTLTTTEKPLKEVSAEKIKDNITVSEILPQMNKAQEFENGAEMMSKTTKSIQEPIETNDVFKAPLPITIPKSGKTFNNADMKMWYEKMNFGKFFETKVQNSDDTNVAPSTSPSAANTLRSILHKPDSNKIHTKKSVTIVSPTSSISSVESYEGFVRNNPFDMSTDIEMESGNSTKKNVTSTSINKFISNDSVNQQTIKNAVTDENEPNLTNSSKDKPLCQTSDHQSTTKASMKDNAIKKTLTKECTVKDLLEEPTVKESITTTSIKKSSIEKASTYKNITKTSNEEPVLDEQNSEADNDKSNESKSDSDVSKNNVDNIETNVASTDDTDNNCVNNKPFILTTSSSGATNEAKNLETQTSNGRNVNESNKFLEKSVQDNNLNFDFLDNSNDNKKSLENENFFDDSQHDEEDDDSFGNKKKSKNNDFLF